MEKVSFPDLLKSDGAAFTEAGNTDSAFKMFFSSVLFGQLTYLIVDTGCEAISGQNKKG